MSISGALNNALSGLTASARMAEVVSSNVSNALTDGYARRRVDLSAAHLGTKGAGVRIDGITRLSDRGLLADRRLADADVGQFTKAATTLQAIVRDFGEAGDPAGLGGRLAAFEQSLISAASDPASDLRLGEVAARLKDLTSTLKDHSKSVQTQRQDADKAIVKDVEVLNASLQQVEKLNADILQTRNAGNDPSALIDMRQTTIDKIATITPIREISRANGQIALMTVTGATLIDGPAGTLTFTPTPTITADMTLASGALSGVSLNGQPMDAANGFGRFKGGSLSAAFELRDSTLTGLQAGLDEIAQDLVTRFANPATDPTVVPGAAGLITDNGGAFDPADIIGLSQRLKLNASVDPNQGGLLSRLRDGVAATMPGAVGNPAQLNAFADALRAPQNLPGTSNAFSAAGLIGDFTAKIGTLRINAEEKLGFETARWETMKSAELAQGVDTDQEMQQLLRVEQAYAANARVMQTVDQMIQRLMEI